MNAENRDAELPQAPGGETPPSASRRRLFRGVAGGAGVLLSVHAKTALGTAVCKSPSAILSGNTSPRVGLPTSTCSGGRSPGFWKVPQKFVYWPSGCKPATFRVSVDTCSTGMQGLTLADVSDHGTRLAEVFPGASGTFGLWAVLAFPNECGGQLLRHLTAAYLNAKTFKSSTQQYPLTDLQVVDIWRQLNSGGIYCPGSMMGACGSSGWTSQQVISYIEGLYGINAEVPSDPSLCKR